MSVLQAIQAIADQWKELYLEILPHKDRGHFKLKSVILYFSRENLWRVNKSSD